MLSISPGLEISPTRISPKTSESFAKNKSCKITEFFLFKPILPFFISAASFWPIIPPPPKITIFIY